MTGSTAPPGLVVNGGNGLMPTNNRVVALSIASPVPEATKMCVSEKPGLCTNWQALAESFDFTLADAEDDGVDRFIYFHQALSNNTAVGGVLIGVVRYDKVSFWT